MVSLRVTEQCDHEERVGDFQTSPKYFMVGLHTYIASSQSSNSLPRSGVDVKTEIEVQLPMLKIMLKLLLCPKGPGRLILSVACKQFHRTRREGSIEIETPLIDPCNFRLDTLKSVCSSTHQESSVFENRAHQAINEDDKSSYR